MKNKTLVSVIALSMMAGSAIAATSNNPSNATNQAQAASKKLGDCLCGTKCAPCCEENNQTKQNNK